MLPCLDDQPRDVASVEHLYRAYQHPVRAHLARLVGDDGTAEDLCQETFLKAWRAWEKRNPETSVAAWLYRIATNTAYDHLRRCRRIRFTPLAQIGEPSDEQRSMELQLESQEPVMRALAQLPELYRLPLVLYSCEGRSIREIASTLGCSSNCIKTRLVRARERFRQVYQD